MSILNLNKCEASDVEQVKQNGIKIGLLPNPREAQVCKQDDNICEPGHFVRSTQLTLGILGIPLEKQYFVAHNRTGYGVDAFLGELVNGTYDTGVPQFLVTPERLQYLIFSEPFDETTMYIYSR